MITPYDELVATTCNNLQGIFDFGNRVIGIFARLKSDAEVGETFNALWSLEGVNVYLPLLRKCYITGADVVDYAFKGMAPTGFVTMANPQNIDVSEAAAGILLSTVAHTSIHEGQWEIGPLKALGFKATFPSSTWLLEALILGLLAEVMGVLVSSMSSILSIGLLLPTGFFLPTISSFLPRIELKSTLGWRMMAVGLSNATSLTASLIPSYLAAKLQSIEAIRRD